MSRPDFEIKGNGAVKLVARGIWTVSEIGAVSRLVTEAVAAKGTAQSVEIDVSGITAIDTAGAFLIDRSARQLTEAPAAITGSEEATALLAQAREVALRCDNPPKPRPHGHGLMDLLERTGRGAAHMGAETLETLSFMGATLAAVANSIIRPTRMRWTAFVAVMEDSGLDAVPIVAFLSFFVGMVVAFIGATSLAQLGASIFVVELVGIGLLRELAGVLVAVIVAGRTNSAFTAQIGAMKMRQEIDAMQTLGLDPMNTIVAPRVLAMVIMLPVLTLVGMLAGLAGGIMVGWLALDINPTVFFNRMQDYVPISQFWIGMSKAPVFGLAIALIGCRQGLEVGGSVQSLGEHTTKSVVQAIFAIIVIDALFAMFYMEVGL